MAALVQRIRARAASLPTFDIPFLLILLLLLSYGLIMLFSAGYAVALYRRGDAYTYIRPQLLFAALGVLAMYAASLVDYHVWHRLAWPMLGISLLLLAIVLFMPEYNGCKRWIVLPGLGTLQPSEIAKFSIVLVFSHIISLNHDRMKSFSTGVVPFALILGVVTVLMLLEPHLSGTLLILSIGAVLMFVGGTGLHWFGLAGGLGAAAIAAADKYQSIVKQQYDIIQDRFNDGMISRTDLLMISTRLKEAELQYIKARQNYTLALQKLNILMGEKPNNPVDSLYTIDTASAPVQILSLENVLQRRADYESTEVNIMKSQAQRKAALSQFNPQLNMYFSGGWATATPNLGYDVSFNPIVGINLNIPIFRWGARFKTNRQQKAYIGIQTLQQSYVTDNINEELSAALTKLTETEYQVKTAKETMSLANENLDLVSFSYNEGKANMVDVLSAQLSWTQAHTNLINAYLSEKMAVAEYRKVISE